MDLAVARTRRARAGLVAGALFAAAVSAVVATPPAGALGGSLSQAWERVGDARFHSSSPTVADVDGDGTPEIVIGDLEGWLHVYDKSGNDLPGWPQKVQPDGAHPTAVEAGPTVADLDKDGKVEIVVGATSTWVPNQQGGLVVFNRDGGVRWTWRGADEFTVWGMGPNPDGYTEGAYSTPAVGDVDGDGFPDVVFGGWDLRIHALDRNGQELPGFPLWNDDTVWSSPALYDVDGDGRLEIFIGGDSTAGGDEDYDGGQIRARDVQGGAVHHLWKRTFAETIYGSPAIGDINGDGRPELVTRTGDFYKNDESSRVHAIHLDDGSNVPGWPVSTGTLNRGEVALGDVTGDDGGNPEVVLGGDNGVVYAFRGNGALHVAVDPHLPGEGGGQIVGTPVIADVDGNGRNDIVVGNGWATFVMNGDGGRLTAPVAQGWSFHNSPAVANFPGVGWRLIVAGFHRGPDVPESAPDADGRIAAYAIDAPALTPPWPQWRKNALHLGADPTGGDPLPPWLCRRPSNPPADPEPASSNGYWLLDANGGVAALGGAPFFGSLPGLGIHTRTRAISASHSGHGYLILGEDGGVFAFGDAAFHGSMGGVPLNGPIIGLAATTSGNGYWLLGRDGGVFSFGDARFFGSMGGLPLNAPIISLLPTPSGNGYWLLAADGGVFSFGDARFFGSTGGMVLNAPVISMAAHPAGGYWLLARDGGVFSFGVAYQGSIPGTGLCHQPPGMQIRPTLTGDGYFLAAADGMVFAFGDALHRGDNFPKDIFFDNIVDMTLRR
ncbi:MAG: FG-GAP-like repeat-containing protein [Acidimicrobiia bacterium]